ncbi:MAG: hypothetical protein JSV05_01085 [Candidatus Bathyarchaeota archaeon]|nr:MAG: hypothetical protein JSV05_01085 [Candidatus Bathyarchaeota archaeon]
MPFSLRSTLQCGQLFRWKEREDWWYGIVGQQAFKIQQVNDVLKFKGRTIDFMKNYFRLDDDLQCIGSRIGRDSLVKKAVHAFYGLRIVRQDPWECLVSYVCATYKNIPAIKGMIFELSKRFGERITFEKYDFYTFPRPEELARAALDDLMRCGLGFRAIRIREIARMINRHNDIETYFQALKEASYESARNQLLQLPGVGYKVADCVLLFSLEKLEAFPIDVWIKRIIQRHYIDHFERSFIQKLLGQPGLSSKDYKKISSFARDYFGEYAGYAQEYLFHYYRSG